MLRACCLSGVARNSAVVKRSWNRIGDHGTENGPEKLGFLGLSFVPSMLFVQEVQVLCGPAENYDIGVDTDLEKLFD